MSVLELLVGSGTLLLMLIRQINSEPQCCEYVQHFYISKKFGFEAGSACFQMAAQAPAKEEQLRNTEKSLIFTD